MQKKHFSSEQYHTLTVKTYSLAIYIFLSLDTLNIF